MGKEPKGFVIYGDTQEVVDRLSDADAGQLLKGMLGYFNSGKEPKFKGILEFVFIPIRQQMDRDADKYEAKCERMRENANKRWQNANASNGMQLDANDANTNTNTKTNTKTKGNINTTPRESGSSPPIDEGIDFFADIGEGEGIDFFEGIS